MSKQIIDCYTNQPAKYSQFDTSEIREVGSKKRKYKIKCKIGSGSQGSAYKASDIETDQDVIIKTTEDLESSEIGCLKKVTKEFPNDPRYLQYIDDEGTKMITDYDPTYITIDKFINENKITKKQMMKIIENIDDAITDLEKKRINHGDLKPENILVHPETLEIKLIDFGLCDYDSNYYIPLKMVITLDNVQLYSRLYRNLSNRISNFEPKSKNKTSCLNGKDINEECKKLNSTQKRILEEILKVNTNGLFLPKITLEDALKLFKEDEDGDYKLNYIILMSEDDNYIFLYRENRNIYFKEIPEKSLINVLKSLDILLLYDPILIT